MESWSGRGCRFRATQRTHQRRVSRRCARPRTALGWRGRATVYVGGVACTMQYSDRRAEPTTIAAAHPGPRTVEDNRGAHGMKLAPGTAGSPASFSALESPCLDARSPTPSRLEPEPHQLAEKRE
jgi:hypothetical protein